MIASASITRLQPNVTLPRVRLWIFNHDIRGITEQVEFFVLSMRQYGYSVAVSKHPDPEALNVVIENFNHDSLDRIREFCRTYGKRVAVIHTEHLDFTAQGVEFHGQALGLVDDYMSFPVKRIRLLCLSLLTEYVSCFFRLGDLPALAGISEMYPGIPIYSIPFPALPAVACRNVLQRRDEPAYDFIFSGKLTSYRRQVLEKISNRYRARVLEALVSRHRRDWANFDARFVLNIPQREDWKWVSSMRVLAALRCGRATVSLNTALSDQISPFCINLSISEAAGPASASLLASYQSIYSEKMYSYNEFAHSASNARFPSDVFRLWADIEL